MSSPIRCRGSWKIHKRASEPDRWLDEMGFFRKHTARDSSCLFRAVSENIYNTQRYFHRVRLDCIKFMSSNRHLFEGSLNCPFENYLKEMSNPSEWGGLIEISAMSHLYRRDFVIFEANKGPQTKICNGYGDTIYLFYSPETKHFDAVYTKEFITASSYCQSIVYEILYDGVYQLKDLTYAVDKMLHDKVPTNHIEYFMSENVERRKKQKERAKIYIEAASDDDKEKNNNAVALKCKHHTEDLERASLLKESLSIFVFNRSLIQLENVCMNCLNVNSAKDLLDNGITPFPYKVAKALDPDIYRNIEFDVWSELRRELRYGARYSDGTTLQVGVKCLCKLHTDQASAYHCHIQEMRPDGGPCLVFIEELGEKHIVNYEQLEPLPVDEIRPWAPPYRYSRANSQLLNLSQMLQQLGNITRKQGLKTRNKPKSEDTKGHDKTKEPVKMDWAEDQLETPQCPQYGYPACQHLDYVNFEPAPVEVDALPLMVDCRPAGASPHELAHPTNGTAPSENHHNQPGGNEMAGHSIPPQGAAARASTPNIVTAIPITGPLPAPGPLPYPCAPYACGAKLWCGPHSPHAPHAAHAQPPAPPVNPMALKSVQTNGADLPMNECCSCPWWPSLELLEELMAPDALLPLHDIPTLRYFFNLGVDCMWATYGPPPHVQLQHPQHPQHQQHLQQAQLPQHPQLPQQPQHPQHPPHAQHPQHPQHPPRHYSPRDLAQDMQAVSLNDRPNVNHVEHNHKNKNQQNEKPHAGGGKGNGQRPLLGPRFKRGNNQDGNQNHNNNQHHNNNNNHKGHNNAPNKGSNYRRNSYPDGMRGQPHPGYPMGVPAVPGMPGVPGVAAVPGMPGMPGVSGEGECILEAPMLSVPYMPYPPPMYPVPYYAMEHDPAMMGMMGGMGYVEYSDGVEYAPQPCYYPQPYAPLPMEHK